MEYVLFFYPRVVHVWQLATVPFADDLMEQSSQAFLKVVRVSSKFDAMWRVEIMAAYIAYQIWFARNMGVFQGEVGAGKILDREGPDPGYEDY